MLSWKCLKEAWACSGKGTVAQDIHSYLGINQRLMINRCHFPLPNMNALHHFIDDEGHYIKPHTILHTGDAVVVVQREDVAIKMAVVYKNDTLEKVEENRSKIRREQDVWRRIQPNFDSPVEGIVHCLDLPGDTIEMRYMSGGTLSKWLKSRARPSIDLQREWFRQLTIGLHNLHQRRIIHSDILSRNILLDGSLNLAICDFGASSIMPIGTIMADTVDEYNCSIWTDICQLGLVFYEIVTGRETGISLYHNSGGDNSVARFPSRDVLPVVGSESGPGISLRPAGGRVDMGLQVRREFWPSWINSKAGATVEMYLQFGFK